MGSMQKRLVTFLLLSLFWLFGGDRASCLHAATNKGDLSISQILSDPDSHLWTLQNISQLQSFYQARAFQRAWTPALLDNLILAINNSSDHGLSPCDYRVALLEDLEIAEVQRELLATDSYLTLASHLLTGKVDPISIEPGWTAVGRHLDLVVHLEKALKGRMIQQSLEALAPHYPEYEELKQALASYRGIAKHGGWGQVSPGKLMRLGSRGERVVELRERLKASGDLETDSDEDPAEFSKTLEQAVIQFQKSVNLETDGIVGPNVLRNLNKHPEDRIGVLRINMERWRWLPEDLGRRHIRVNIAGFFLETYENWALVARHKVIVGLNYRQSPIFSDAIEYLIFNPWWYAPRKVAVKDKLPMFRYDPGYFHKSGFQLLDRDGKQVAEGSVNWNRLSENNFPYQLRQMPGPKNALGRVKFIFPNKYDVYLHDTPSIELFAKIQRGFSSGCIRVEKPLDLAEWILSAQSGWNLDRIEKVVDRGKETRINLVDPLPIHLLYWTVFVDRGNKEVRFINDQYQRDPLILAALDTMCPIAQ